MKICIKDMIKNNNKGIGLIEVIVSLGISTVIITSLIALSIFTLRSSLKGKLFFEASNATSKQLEMVRAYRDSNKWSDFKAALEEELYNCTDTTNSREILCHMSFEDDNGSSEVKINRNPVLLDQDGSPSENQEADQGLDQISAGFYVKQLQDDTDIVQIVSVAKYYDSNVLKEVSLMSDFTNWQRK